MSVSKQKLGEHNNREVFSYVLDNENGLSVEILNYGGIVRKLIYKGIDVVLGCDKLEDYIVNEEYFGAIVGRNSNRIENSEFELNRKIYKLNSNDGKNNLHGGYEGFNKKVWDAEILDKQEPALSLSLLSRDREEGFPGNVSVNVIYKVKKDNSLEIHYMGNTDEDTVLNMTNHSYFNLNGHNCGTVLNHSLWLNSSFYTPNSGECVPTGEILNVKNTPFDFSDTGKIGESLKSEHPQIRMFNGFDHNFVIRGRGLRLAAKLHGDESDIHMEMYTDQPGMQLYTANSFGRTGKCKDLAYYAEHSGVCLETQAFPNNMKFSHFPSTIIRKNEQYDTKTIYKFIQL